MSWLSDLQGHFRGRAERPVSDLLAEFDLPSPFSADDLKQALGVFQEEFNISPFVLRRDDRLDVFTKGPTTRNPIAWFFERSQFEDRMSEVNYHLKKARKRVHSPDLTRSPETIREYVLAWTGSDLPMKQG